MVPNGVRPPQDPPKAAKATKADKFFSAQTVPFDLSVDPWWSVIVSGLPRTLQRPQGRKGHKGRNLFLAQTVSFHQSVNPLWSLMVPDCVGPTRDPPKASKGRKGRQILFGSNGSFRPKRRSLVVPDSIGPPRDSPVASRPQRPQRPKPFNQKKFGQRLMEFMGLLEKSAMTKLFIQ